MKSRWLKFVIFNALFALTLYAVAKSLDWGSLSSFDYSKVNYFLLTASLVAYCVYITLNSLGAARVLSYFTGEYKQSTVNAYNAAQIFKYLPAGIFSFSAKVYFLKRFGYAVDKLLTAVFMEHLLTIYFGLLIFALIGYFPVGLALGLIALAIIWLEKNQSRSILNRIPLLRRLNITAKLSVTEITKLGIIYGASYLAGGLGLYLLTMALNQPSQILQSIQFHSGSGAASVLVVFAPAGLGVREFLLNLGQFSFVSILWWRLIGVAGDLALSLVGILRLRSITGSLGK